MRGYRVYHSIHPGNSARGGSAVIIKENIIHYEEEKYEKEEIQATMVRIKMKNYFITVTGLYCPPRHSLKKNQYMELLKRLGKIYIVGGAFNAKNTFWGSRLTTSKDKKTPKSH